MSNREILFRIIYVVVFLGILALFGPSLIMSFGLAMQGDWFQVFKLVLFAVMLVVFETIGALIIWWIRISVFKEKD
ncbi:MAG: hypothetical protein KC423_29725, partial [Anaerolineales bacterium]|nr:hypothetical protein [Anaerolineales bacterium]